MTDQIRISSFRRWCAGLSPGIAAWGMVFLLASGSSPLWGSVTGSISGTVTDPSGAMVPSADVAALSVETGIRHTTQTNVQGFYAFPVLPVGHYDVSVQAKGFKEYKQTGLMLNVNSAIRVDVALEVGAVTQEVSVSAAAVHVETTNTQMGEVIGTSRIMGMPLNGRSYTDLLALQPGVVPIGSGSYSSTSVSGNLNAGNLSVSGMREGSNGFMVNGAAAQEVSSMGTAIIPNLDSIAEFRIVTNSADAEYGNYSGGMINVLTKSGTNKFHGNLFEYLRNSNMDARNFYSPARGSLHQNEFGGSFGGPIRRDKVFFFSDYQGQRRVVGVDSGLVSVPSIANKQGSFADVAGKLTGTVKGSAWASDLSQRLGYAVTPGEPYYTAGCTSSANCVFPNAIIPPAAMLTVGKNLLKYVPDPNAGVYYTTSAFPSTLRDDKWSSRIDANTAIGMISGYYFWDDYVSLNPFPVNIPGFSATSNGRAQTINLGITKPFGGNSVNELRLSYMRDVNFINQPKGGVGTTLSSLGFTLGAGTGSSFNGGIVAIGPEAVPKIGMNNFTLGAVQESSLQFANTYQILDNFSKVRGTHTIKFGGSAGVDQFKREGQGTAYWTGYFNFNGNETGSDIADLLIGAPFQYEVVAVEPVHTQSYKYGLYIQDSWRAKPTLTVNYGLRWDVASPWYEVFGRQETFVYGCQSKTFPGSPLGWVFPGDPCVPKTVSPVRHNNFAPRLGLAYSPSTTDGFWGRVFGGAGKTSIRAAFGFYYTGFEDRYVFQIQGDAPYGNAYSSPVPPRLDKPFLDRQDNHNQGQRVPIVFPARNVSPSNPDNTIDWSIFLPISGSPGWDTTNRVPYAEHYSFSIQREFGANTLLSLSYVGTQGHRLLAAVENNPGNPALCLSVSQPSQVVAGTPTCGPGGENGVYHPIGGGIIDGTRYPYGPAFGSNALFSTRADSAYHGLETSLRRTAGRFEFLAAYTYSKSLDNSSSWGNNSSPTGGDMVNFFDPRLSRSLSAFDMRHNFVVSYSYRVPFDKLWQSNRLTSGWILQGITRFSNGIPVTLQERDDQDLLGTASAGGVGHLSLPNYTPGSLNITDPRLANRSAGTNPFFNKALFAKPALGKLGTANKRFFAGPGLNNFDLSLQKEVRLTESSKLEIRGEFFNTFNHAQFGQAQGNFLNSAFGYVTSARDPRIGQVAMKLTF